MDEPKEHKEHKDKSNFLVCEAMHEVCKTELES
jgi:hypothetical protein